MSTINSFEKMLISDDGLSSLVAIAKSHDVNRTRIKKDSSNSVVVETVNDDEVCLSCGG